MSGALERAEREAAAAREAVAAATERMNVIAERIPGDDLGTAMPPAAVLPPPPPKPATTPLQLEEGGEADEKRESKVKVKKELRDPYADGMSAYWKRSIHELVFTSQLNWLLLCTPVAAFQVAVGGSDTSIFLFSLLAIAPFAERLSFVTEQLALHTSETLGGLLNATFGNVTELIVSLFALKAGLFRIVQVSLLGSILSNLLLVLGTAFLVGGLRHPEQRYNKTAQTASFGLLLLATMGLTFPMVLDVTHEQLEPDSSLLVSRLVSILMLITYCLYLAFQLGTHAHIFEDNDDDDDDDDDDDEEEAILGAWGAIFWLAVITVFIAYLSEWMVDAIRGTAEDLKVPDLFLGTIVIPIVGNAAEHAAAIIFAAKNKMELSLGIAVGSATQIALFVLPLCIAIAWWLDQPLSMDLHPFETASLLITVLLVGVLIQTGESHWLAGIILIIAYLMISVGFFFHVDVTPS